MGFKGVEQLSGTRIFGRLKFHLVDVFERVRDARFEAGLWKRGNDLLNYRVTKQNGGYALWVVE